MAKRRRRPRRKPPRADGRRVQVHYTPAVAREVCERIARGEPWTHVCNTGRLPAVATLYVWRDRYPLFAEALAQAREVARDAHLGRPVGAWPQIFEKLETTMDEPEDEPRPARWRKPPRKRSVGRNGRKLEVRYGADVTRRICERLATGEFWARICNTDGLPSHATLYYWQRKHPEFAAAVEAARRIAAEARFEMALEVAAASTPATVQSDRLHVATLLTHAERMDPERFGRRGGGAGGEPPVRMIVVRRFERARREDGTEYVRVIDDLQQVEDQR
jgi:hypothetical protein